MSQITNYRITETTNSNANHSNAPRTMGKYVQTLPTEKGAKMTQYEKILQYIDDFGSISPMEAFSDLGITKLATRISEMRKDGIEFDQVWECSKNRYGQKVHYMRYSKGGKS